MRCYICDEEITEPQFDRNHMALPCGTCQEVIDETLEDYDKDDIDAD